MINDCLFFIYSSFFTYIKFYLIIIIQNTDIFKADESNQLIQIIANKRVKIITMSIYEIKFKN